MRHCCSERRPDGTCVSSGPQAPKEMNHLWDQVLRTNYRLAVSFMFGFIWTPWTHTKGGLSRFITAGLTKDCRVGLRWTFCCGCPISKSRPVLDSLSKLQRLSLWIFWDIEKSKNELVWAKMMFFSNIASRTNLWPRISSFSDYAYCFHETSLCLRVQLIFSELIRTN